MSEIKVKEYLKKYHLDTKIITMPSSTATVKEAAESLGCEEARIAKTLSFKTARDTILIVTAGDVKIDNAKYREYFHEKAKMLSPDEVETKIGHPIGGVCPFGVNENVKIYLDESLKRFTTVYPACGSPHNAIEISIEELSTIIDFVAWIDVSKTKEQITS